MTGSKASQATMPMPEPARPVEPAQPNLPVRHIRWALTATAVLVTLTWVVPQSQPTAENLRSQPGSAGDDHTEVHGAGPDATEPHAGEHEQLSAHGELALRAGDAAALRHWINGMPGRRLGGAGQVRQIHVTPENYRSFVATESAS